MCRGEVHERHEHVDRVHGRDEARVAPRVHVRPIRMPPTSSSSRLRLLLLQRTQPSARTLPSSSSPHPHLPHQCGHSHCYTHGPRSPRREAISGHLGSSRVISHGCLTMRLPTAAPLRTTSDVFATLCPRSTPSDPPPATIAPCATHTQKEATPLHLACNNGHAAVVDALIAASANRKGCEPGS